MRKAGHIRKLVYSSKLDFTIVKKKPKCDHSQCIPAQVNEIPAQKTGVTGAPYTTYVHYFKFSRILEGSFRDFLDSVSVERPEKNTIELTLFYVINLLTNTT